MKVARSEKNRGRRLFCSKCSKGTEHRLVIPGPDRTRYYACPCGRELSRYSRRLGRFLVRVAALLLLAIPALAQWSYVEERTVWAPSGNVSWHGLAETPNGNVHGVGYRGNNVWAWTLDSDWNFLIPPRCLSCDLSQRTDEPHIAAKGGHFAIGASDRSQEFAAADMTVLLWPGFADGSLAGRFVLSMLTQSNWLLRPYFLSPGNDVVGGAFVGQYNEDAFRSTWSYTPGPVEFDLQFSRPSGARQTYVDGAANRLGEVLVWLDHSIGNGSVVTAFARYGAAPGPERLVAPGRAIEPRVFAHPLGWFVVVFQRGPDVFYRLLTPRGRPHGPVRKLNHFAGGFCRDPHVAFDETSISFEWERVMGGRRRLEWRRFERDGAFDPEVPVLPQGQDDPYTPSQNHRGAHGFSVADGVAKFPTTREGSTGRLEARVAIWAR